MSLRPAEIWKSLPIDTRVAVADAFWRDDQSQDIQAQHVEAVVALARRLNFRPKSLQALPVERRAKQLAQMDDVSDGVATRALIAFHFTAKRPLMGAFLDALGIAHDQGLITADEVAPPARERLVEAARALKGGFPDEDVSLYLRTLSALDGDTWGQLDGVWPLSP
jgi:hypothetical protein